MIDARLEEIKKLSASDLWQRDNFRKIDELADQYYRQFYIGEAGELWHFLTEKLESVGIADRDFILYERYQKIIIKLAWTACSLLPDSAVETLFRSKIMEAIKLKIKEADIEINLIDKVKGFIDLVFGDFSAQENKRLVVLKALKANEENIGNSSITIEGRDGEFPPTISNWLKDYDQSSRLEQRKERLRLLEYLNTNQNVRKLSQGDKLSLRKVLGLYDYLRFLSEPGEVSTTTHRLPNKPIVLSEPSFSGVGGSSKESIFPAGEIGGDEILAAYQGDLRQQKAIVKLQEKLAKKFADNIEKLRAEFFKAVQNKDAVKTIVLLRLLAQKNDLQNFIQQDQKLNKFLAATWEKQYGPALVAEFKARPAQPKFIRLFLRYVLEQRLSMPSSEAARVGMQLGNILVAAGKKDYNKMAFFDVKTKKFEWFE